MQMISLKRNTPSEKGGLAKTQVPVSQVVEEARGVLRRTQGMPPDKRQQQLRETLSPYDVIARLSSDGTSIEIDRPSMDGAIIPNSIVVHL